MSSKAMRRRVPCSGSVSTGGDARRSDGAASPSGARAPNASSRLESVLVRRPARLLATAPLVAGTAALLHAAVYIGSQRLEDGPESLASRRLEKRAIVVLRPLGSPAFRELLREQDFAEAVARPLDELIRPAFDNRQHGSVGPRTASVQHQVFSCGFHPLRHLLHTEHRPERGWGRNDDLIASCYGDAG